MVLKRLPRNAAMDGVDLYRRLDPPGGSTTLADPARVDAVLNEVRRGLLADLATESTLRGWRAQALFASLVAALDECDLMTLVDTGDIYFDGASVKAPDYFLHLRSGRRILVDVKAVEFRKDNPLDMPVKFGTTEVERMKRFGELYGAEVFLAIYYSDMPMWTLVPLDDLKIGPGGGQRITVRESLFGNQIGLLGDLHIGAEHPLELVLRPDPTMPHHVDESGQAVFTIGSIELLVGGRPLATKEANHLAYFLMLYGGWESEEIPTVDGDDLVEIRYVARPPEDTGQGFEIIGSLSTMYSRLFESSTSGPSGTTALDISIRPGLLVSLVPHDYESSEFPLWRLHLKPASTPSGEAVRQSDPHVG